MFQDSSFAFGQRGGYFFGCQSKQCHGSTPKKLRVILGSKDVDEVWHVTLGAGSSFFIGYRAKDGTHQIRSDGLPIHLQDFLTERDRYNRYSRDIKNIRVAIGPENASWYATDGKSWMWQNLPADLENALHAQKSSAGRWTSPPRIVALGAEGDFVLITESNAATWILSHYSTLNKMIQFSKTQVNDIAAVKEVILHSYRYQCFVAQSNNGTLVSENVPPHAEHDMDAVKKASQATADRRAGKLYRTPSQASPSLQATLHREWTNQARQAGDDLAREYKLKLSLNVSIAAGSFARLFG